MVDYNNPNIIRIPEQLSNYINRLYYEKEKIADLMNTIDRSFTDFTDEEWNDSYQYFENKLNEAILSYDIAIDWVKEEYKDLIGNAPWDIDFNFSCILLNGYKITERKTPIDYANRLVELYDDYENKTGMKIGGNFCRNITLQLTDDCNMRCTYCYQHDKGNHKMSFETAKTFIDLILNSDERVSSYINANKALGCVLDFIGGEPLLCTDVMSKICKYFIGEVFKRKHRWAINFMISISSNGLLYFEPEFQEFIRLHKGHLSYSVTIDGNKTLHDACRIDKDGNPTYDRAMAAVKDYAAKTGREINSKVTLSPDNIVYLTEAVISLIENDYKDIMMNCVYEKGWETKHATILYNRLKELTDWLEENNHLDDIYISMFDAFIGHQLSEDELQNWCGGTGLMLAMDYKGDMYPCIRYMENSVGNNQEPYIIGNLKEGINCNPEHCARVECMSKIDRRTQSTDECFYCPIASGCSWCSGYNYEIFGTPDKRATFICVMHKARVMATHYYFRKKGVERTLNIPEEWAVPIIGKEEYERLKVM